MRYIISIYLLFNVLQAVSPHDRYPRNDNCDVLHYEYSLSLNDSTDRIEGRALIRVKFQNEADSFSLDLNGLNNSEKGMSVKIVTILSEELKWSHRNEKLTVFFNHSAKQNDTVEIAVQYSGIPAGGLTISRNKYGDRTFFADHWPDRAHNYLPCIDHPYDKASVDFIITAPDRYKVVANGTLVEESDLTGNITITHWSETVPLATKVMAFGAAVFAVKSAGEADNIPVWTWVFPENRNEGFSDYSVAVKPLEYYSRVIGPYPYKKLANVQSKTIYGGLENAGTIFYSERSVTGLGRAEGLIAHEVAHQWFGNCVTEADWHHVWLSEGFATYLTCLYFESEQGKERLKTDMISARARVLKYNDENLKPVIDTTVTDLMDLLNVNSYQKGAWVLHMLRHDLGDTVFMKGLSLYYNRFYNSNALTEDFKSIMEEVSGKDLGKFFRQWLYTEGQPELRVFDEPGRKKGTTRVIIEQKQPQLFEFPLELLIKDNSGERSINIAVSERVTKVNVSSEKDLNIIIDPDVNLLFK